MARIKSERVAAANSPSRRVTLDEVAFEPLLKRYIEGWAEVNLLKIIASVSENYVLVDPLVGTFHRDCLSAYVKMLREWVGFDTVKSIETKVYLGVMRSPTSAFNRRFWRSLPECGLAGHSDIRLLNGRVVREVVSYEPNIATERLRCSLKAGHHGTGRLIGSR